MYRLFWDDYTGQFFIGNETQIETNLMILRNQVVKRRGFTVNDYCRALGIPEEDPFDTARFSSSSYDIPFLFPMHLGLVNNVVAMIVAIQD